MEKSWIHQEQIAWIIKDFESEIGDIAPGVKTQVNQLLEKYLPDLTSRRLAFSAHIAYSEGLRNELMDYMVQVLQAFYGTVFLLDPQLKNLEIFKKMYLDLCKSFMLDLRALPAMKDVPDMEIKKMVLESRPIW